MRPVFSLCTRKVRSEHPTMSHSPQVSKQSAAEVSVAVMHRSCAPDATS